MSLVSILKNILTEKKGDTYEYGCVMLYFNFPEVNKIHDAINPKDLYKEEGDRTYGIEDEPHTTLLFGLHQEVTPKQVQNTLNQFKFGSCVINNASLFKNEKFDVLKFDISKKGLHAYNKALRDFPHTNSFPDYHPHLTIAYLQPKTNKQYTKILKNISYKLQPQYTIYNLPNNSKIKIKITTNE